MKKIFIPTIALMLITSILVIILYIVNLKGQNAIINNIYKRNIINIVNGEHYNIIEERITLYENTYSYNKTIIYPDTKKITLSKEGIILKKDNTIYLDNKEYLLKNDKLCSDSNCTNYYSNSLYDITNKNNNFNSKDYLIKINDIEKNKNKDSITIIALLPSNTHGDNLIKLFLNVVKEYNTNIYYLKTDELSLKKLNNIKKSYNISKYPSILVFKDGELIENTTKVNNIADLHNLLFNLKIESR